MDSPRIKTGWLKWLTIILVALTFVVVFFRMATTIEPPIADHTHSFSAERKQVGDETYTCDDSWYKKNRYGLWEMYLKGDDFELGIKNGLLAREQIHSQEEVFVARLQEMVPSDIYLRFLKQVVLWMNRKLDKHIPIEYQREIYGVALQASDTFGFIGPAYQRLLNYHAAHDIGHALQNMNLVACTALGVKGGRSKDGEILVGRNFDFSMGDDFAREKIVAFYEPARGYQFASITWGGMIGIVSGMNDQGLVVTLNAAKSGFPKSAKTPTSILARRILQYASTIEEAYALAGQSETFVAESFLISSAMDNKTVVIEKSPDRLALYDPEGDVLVLTNHFQSNEFKNSDLTLKNKEEGASVYRWERTSQLLEREIDHDEISFAAILRDQNGMEDESIGMGNEKAINQLIAHHSVIFKPHELKMWVSTFPYQLGDYLCYDLHRVFSDTVTVSDQMFSSGETIKKDPFISSDSFRRFKEYTQHTTRLKKLIDEKQVEDLDDQELQRYLQLNPHHYYPYFLVGEIHRLKGNNQIAREMYHESLIREIPRKVDREQVTGALEHLEK